VFKTKIKRSEFGINIVLIILLAVNAAILLWSAYGGSCIAWDPSTWGEMMTIPSGFSPFLPPGTEFGRGITMWEFMFNPGTGTGFGWLQQVTNVMTWVTAFLMLFLIYALITKRFSFKITYLATLIVVGVAFIAAFLPHLNSVTNGFQLSYVDGQLVEWKWISDNPYVAPGVTPNPNVRWFSHYYPWDISEFFGGASLAKVMFTLLTLMVLVVLLAVPASNKGLQKFISQENTITRNVGRQLMMMSVFFFWLGGASFLGSGFMKDAHVVNGINVWEMIQLQTLVAWITTIIGTSMLTGGILYSQLKPTKIRTTTLK